MGRELQKKKNRSGISKSRPKTSNSKRTKTGRRKVDFGNNEILSRNWDRKQTLSQNYKRLGLSSKLVAPSGGTEKHSRKQAIDEAAAANSLAIPSSTAAAARNTTGKITHREVRVERDPETGKILRVLRAEGEEEDDDDDVNADMLGGSNPLDDPLNEIEARPQRVVKASTAVVEALEREAAAEEAQMALKRKPRKQSQREEEWIEKLVERYGDDVGKMVRDKRLNPMQQSEGDIKRRIKKWKASHGD